MIQTLAEWLRRVSRVGEASLGGIGSKNALPPGTEVPGIVHYVSRLTKGGSQGHEVGVSIQPLLIWERMQ